MSFQDFAENECVCAFAHNLGPFKDTFMAMLDSIITLLTTVKVTIALWPADLGDQLKKIGYELELDGLKIALAAISAPLTTVEGYFKPFADCPGIDRAAQTMSEIKAIILKPLKDQEDEVNQLIYALDLEVTKIEALDNLISQLTDIKSAIEVC